MFPRRTKATPDDALTFISELPRDGLPDIDEVHISVAFTYDLNRAYMLADEWNRLDVPVYLGGPAFHAPDDCEPLVDADRLLREGGFTRASCTVVCYVLTGYPGDTMRRAEERLLKTWNAGFLPFAMLYRNASGQTDSNWRKFQRLWVRPEIICSRMKLWKEPSDDESRVLQQ